MSQVTKRLGSQPKVIRLAKILIFGTVFFIVAPVILGKLGFWTTSFAETPKFQAPHKPINYNGRPISYAEAISRASGAVVSIHSTKELPKEIHPLFKDPFFRYFFGDPRQQGPGGQGNPGGMGGGQVPNEIQSGIGSGVIVTKNGYVLTNNHVIQDADEIKVKLSDGRSASAKVVGRDPESDLAILKIALDNLPVIAFGSSDNLQVGDIVFAIGNPFGVGQTVTQGIVSATQRSELGINTFENFIQTDAAINPGNSGGALIDVNGNLIGINNAIYSRTGGYQGIGFAIPSSLAQDIMGQLIDKGHVTRGWLGVTVHKLNDDIRKSVNYPKGDGALIAGVIRGGPAYNAGLRPGDVIISLDNKDTQEPSDVLSITAKLKPESAYPVAVVRGGETLDFRVVIGKRPLKKEGKEGEED